MAGKTWLITGATGLLGANASLDLSQTDRVVGVARHAPEGAPIDFVTADLSLASDRARIVERLRPDVVLHCAAVTSHELCEEDPAGAENLNVAASRDLAEQAVRVGSKFVYISTDAVFDGRIGGYRESSPPSPTSVYGSTKLAGERAVLEISPDALVARVNFYGWSPSGRRSLVEFFVNRLTSGERAPGFTDVRVSTMYVGTLVDRIRRLVEIGASGLYHVANDESTTKFAFGQRVAERLGVDLEAVPPALSSDVLAVPRGTDLSLSTDKLRATLKLTSTQESDLHALFAAEGRGRREELRAFSISIPEESES